MLYDRERETKDEQGEGVPARSATSRCPRAGGRERTLAGGMEQGTRAERLQVVVHVDEEVLGGPDAARSVHAGGRHGRFRGNVPAARL